MTKLRFRHVVLTLLCLLILCPPGWARSRNRSEVSFGHPNGTLMLASVRIGRVTLVITQRPFTGLGVMFVRNSAQSQSQSTSTLSVSRPDRTDRR